MPTFDLKHIRAGKYNHANGTTSYTNAVEVGDAMQVDLNLRFAEGRLYAESSLAEYLRSATGGTASIAVKYLKDAFQKLAYGMRSGSRSVNSKSVASLKYGAKDLGDYVGFAFYADDMIDAVKKYTCVLVYRSRFAPPAMQYRTKGENYQFNTPTTTGEFLPDLGTDQDLFEVAVADDEETAAAWVDAAVSYTASGSASKQSVQRAASAQLLGSLPDTAETAMQAAAVPESDPPSEEETAPAVDSQGDDASEAPASDEQAEPTVEAASAEGNDA